MPFANELLAQSPHREAQPHPSSRPQAPSFESSAAHSADWMTEDDRNPVQDLGIFGAYSVYPPLAPYGGTLRSNLPCLARHVDIRCQSKSSVGEGACGAQHKTAILRVVIMPKRAWRALRSGHSLLRRVCTLFRVHVLLDRSTQQRCLVRRHQAAWQGSTSVATRRDTEEPSAPPLSVLGMTRGPHPRHHYDDYNSSSAQLCNNALRPSPW